jgi:hypothetical protein
MAGWWDSVAKKLAKPAAAPKAAAPPPPARSLGLPPIPDGYVRLTHVMPERSREILSSGEPFIYKKHGLDGTTDAYSNNEAIDHLAATGDPMFDPASPGPSAFTRNEFGNHMAIMDLPVDVHKQIALRRVFDDPIPNEAILGFVDRDAMAFSPNPRYSTDATAKFGASAVDRIRELIEQQNRRPMFEIPDDYDPVPPAWVPPSPGSADVW